MKKVDRSLIHGLVLLASGASIHLYYHYGLGDPAYGLVTSIRRAILTAYYTRIVPGPAPYIFCLFLLVVSDTRFLAVGGLAGALLGDLSVFILAFHGPDDYVYAPLGPIFMPRLNLLVLMPLGMAIAAAVKAASRMKGKKASFAKQD